MNSRIVCFEHCRAQIFCFQLPPSCPLCGHSVDRIHILPFSIPYPFAQARDYPCSIVIKPTIGDFLNEYYNSKDLHIGITSSTGLIVEFDKMGLRSHRSNEWNQCLLINKVPSSWFQTWDSIIYKMCKDKNWSKSSYDEKHNNCYSFVLQFLSNLNFEELSEFANDKVKFCEKFIVPKTQTAAKYISLYRKLQTNNYIVKHL